MSIKLENEFCEVVISLFGGEITSFKFKVTNQELIWKKDEQIWKFQTPFLFPKVGALSPKTFQINQQTYTMRNHGFLRNQTLELVKATNTTAILRLVDNEDSRSMYPFKFELNIQYILENFELKIEVSIKNLDEKQMPVEFGYHPAFSIENYESSLIELVKKPKQHLFWNRNQIKIHEVEKIITFNKSSFEKENTLIYSDYGNVLNFHTKNYMLTFMFENLPFLAIWSKDNHFVCVEPWSNIPDVVENHQSWENRDSVLKLTPNQIMKYKICICVKNKK